jgi:2-dehydro-3-deoxyphosphogluconate aldolase/(4S)-4-hydroxy-2-oxoglutarate aldolase
MIELPSAITEQRIIAVARSQNERTVPELASALHAGGLGVLEITVERAQGVEAIAAISGGSTLVGAGTVTTLEKASAAVDAGASFLVSPHLDEDLLEWSRSKGVPLVPGAFTPTEIQTAISAGAPAVKLFPAHLGGPQLVKTLLGPHPDLALIPTGGVDASNAGAYLEAGAVAVGVGGWLTGSPDLEEVTRRARMLASILY